MIDTNRFDQLEAWQDGDDHVSIRPGDQTQLQDWIDSKGTDPPSEFTQEVRNAIIRVKR